jgi:hypothetical protein
MLRRCYRKDDAFEQCRLSVLPRLSVSEINLTRHGRSVSAAITLFFIAPFVAEYLLGDLSLKLLPALIVMAPMYGGGALLIREFARRKRRGWPTILCLGAAYALLEEGLVTQSLFNPDYLKLHMHFLQPAHIALLGIGGWWTMLMLNLHTFWSIGVSIALVEGLVPDRAREPWLGNVGEAISGGIFMVGAVANGLIGFKQNHFWASPLQLAIVAILVVLLVALAFVTPAGWNRRRTGRVPAAWGMAMVAFVAGALVQLIPPRSGWAAVAAMLAVDVVFLVIVATLSRNPGWTALHTLSLAAGGAIEYGVHAFIARPFGASTRTAGWLGNGIFLAIAVVLIAIGVRRTQALVAGEAPQPLTS